MQKTIFPDEVNGGSRTKIWLGVPASGSRSNTRKGGFCVGSLARDWLVTYTKTQMSFI